MNKGYFSEIYQKIRTIYARAGAITRLKYPQPPPLVLLTCAHN